METSPLLWLASSPATATQHPPIHAAPGHIFLRTDRQYIQVPLASIRYIEARKNYCFVVTHGRTHMVLVTLAFLQRFLPAELFFRIHRAFIVNLSHVEWFDRHQIVVAGKGLPVGRSYLPPFNSQPVLGAMGAGQQRDDGIEDDGAVGMQ